MSKLQRVDRLKEPPIVGQQYLVPLVRGQWHGIVRDWPVIGIKHNDAEFLNFPYVHYHLDYRFLRVRSEYLRWCMTAPLHENLHRPGDGLGKPFFGRRTCVREQHIFAGPEHAMQKLDTGFKGVQCAKGKRGFVCPHQQFPLGSTPAIDGVITCPLHGLRIDAESGVVLGANIR